MSRIRGNTEFEWELAIKQGDIRRIQTLARHKVKPCDVAILYSLTCGRPDLLPLLAEAGADPNEPNGYGETPLGRAVMEFEPSVVEQLLKLGASPEIESLMTKPLVQAALFGKVETAKVLLNYGANPNAPQPSGLTALLEAVRYNYQEIVQLLLQHGADPLFKGPDGRNAIELAKSLKLPELVRILEPFARENPLQRANAKGAPVSKGRRSGR